MEPDFMMMVARDAGRVLAEVYRSAYDELIDTSEGQDASSKFGDGYAHEAAIAAVRAFPALVGGGQAAAPTPVEEEVLAKPVASDGGTDAFALSSGGKLYVTKSPRSHALSLMWVCDDPDGKARAIPGAVGEVVRDDDVEIRAIRMETE